MIDTLRVEDAREHIELLVSAALAAVEPGQAIRTHLWRDGDWLIAGDNRLRIDPGQVKLLAVGKAAVPMATAAAEILENRLRAGLVVTKKGQPPLTGFSKITTLHAAHPISDESSVQAGRAALDFLHGTPQGDTILFLISGGASALLTKPLVSLERWRDLNGALLASGCTIQALNTVRKQLDGVKGGGLLRAAGQAQSLSLILSDVIGNPVGTIGSGPTVPNAETPADALAVIDRFAPDFQDIRSFLERQPPPTSTAAAQVVIVGDNQLAGRAACRAASDLGFETALLTWHIEGEAREVGMVAAALGRDADPGRCLVLGGETTVTLRGDGLGGRNLELALSAAIAMEGVGGVTLATLATDGDDGPTGAAGAIVNGQTVRSALAAGLDPREALARNDSFTFFREIEELTGRPALLLTGQTGTNVNDLIFILTYPE